ncbi:MAG: hypothetical protein K9M45_06265, partial [Kiritimatiellales bacterium]|nr:hypothetical protein [Kiritimatiellales bacterium]
GRARPPGAPNGRLGDPSLPISLVFAIPDHPWVDAADGAAVRIAMTTAAPGAATGLLQHVVEEKGGDGEGFEVKLDSKTGTIHSDLSAGADLGKAVALCANGKISSRGFELGSDGFIVTSEEAIKLGLGRIEGIEKYIRAYRNGKDLASKPRGVLCIDPWDLDESSLMSRFPEIYQWLSERVKPKRLTNRDPRLRKLWWLHRRSREDLRQLLLGVDRYIATVETSKHRLFQFLEKSILPDNKLISIALDDAFYLGILSSRIHVDWAMASGSNLGVGNDSVYVKTRCFETFPFPEATEEQRARIRALGEQLDAHRKRQQEQHPGLTMTGMYNVLAKLRSGEALTAKEKTIHEQGLVSVLMQLHDELDAAVAQAYGWPANLSDEEILERLVALNTERAAEEAQGKIRWLRPEFQCPEAVQTELEVCGADIPVCPSAKGSGQTGMSAPPKTAWPKSLPDQVRLLRTALAATAAPVTAEELARTFTRARTDRVADLLETLATLGQARKLEDGRYSAG